MKRVISILLVALMLFGMLPSTAVHSHAAEGTWTLVTDANTLAEGDQVVIAASGSNYALGTTQNTNNRAAVTISKSGDTITIGNGVQILTLKTGTVAGTWAFYTGSGYLYAASSSSNHLKTQATNDANSSWKVTITPAGVATIQAQGTNSRNLLKKNSSSALFSCYKSGQNDVALYKLITETACTHINITTTTVPATCTDTGSITVTCDDCGETVSTETIDALGHSYEGGTCTNCGDSLPTVSFVVPSQIGTVAPIIANEDGTVKLPSVQDYNGKYSYSFVGWAEASVSDTETEPTLYGANTFYTATKNTTLYAVYTYTVAGAGGSIEYVLKDIGNIKTTDAVVVTMTTSTGIVYALSSTNGTNKAPAATVVTVANNKLSAAPADDLVWNIGGSAGKYIFYPSGTTATWLYCTSTNNGVRVGTNDANTFSIDATSGYLKHNDTGRFLGVYLSTPDWRCYTNTTGNTANQTLGFFVKTIVAGDVNYFTSVLEDADTTCQHTNTTETTVDPTCTGTGMTTVTCDDCGAVISETVISATGHTVVTDAAVDATCANAGLTEGSHCSVCNAVLVAQTEIPATGNHSYEDGYCTVCGASDPNVGGKAYQLVTDAKEITAGGQFVIVATDSNGNHFALPTSIASKMSGVTVNIEDNKVVFVEGTTPVWTVESSGDGFALTNGTNYLKYSSSTNLGSNGSTPYTWTLSEVSEGVYKVVANSDTNRGLVFRAASYNQYGGYSLSNVTTSSTEYFGVKFYKMVVLCNHINTENHDEVAATCTTVGYTAGVYCNDCESYISGHEVIDMIDHRWNDGVETTAPGCETTGVMTYTCSACGETKTEEIVATGHTMGEGVVVEATCETAGSKTYTCTVCGKVQVETIAALGHKWDEGTVVTAATCESAGKMTYVCQNDKTHTKDEEIPALGHKWGTGVETTAATCDTAGVMTYTCENDADHTKTEAIPAWGHSYGDDNICDNCGKEIGYFQHITDYTKILAGGEYVIAAKYDNTFYALGTDVDSEPTAYEVAVVGTGANMMIQYADTVPIWNIEYFMHKTNCVALSTNGSYLKGTNSTSFGNNGSTPWAWTFADSENDAQAVQDGVFAVQRDGLVAYVLVSESISDRAISYANGGFHNYSIRSDFNRELYFFKMVEADATEYTATFVEDGITTMTQTVSADENVIKMPQPTSGSLPEGYTKFVGWVTLPHDESLIAPAVIYSAEEGDGYNNTMPLTEDTTFYALYSREDYNAEGQAMSYHLVTDQNQLVVGQDYIIVGLHTDGNYYAMSEKQLSDDRGASLVTPDAEGVITFVPQDQIAVFQLQQGYEIGSFAFLDLAMNKFLFCASSTENSLNSQATLNEAASFTITVHNEADGYYSVMLDGLYGNRLMFNNDYTSSSDRFFSCYGAESGVSESSTFLYVGVPNSTFATYYTTGLCHHVWVETAKVEATCANPGYTQHTCSICGEIKLEDVQAHGHDIGTRIIITEPTCTTTGLATSTCTKCGTTFEEVIPATGHTEVTDAAVAPTCTETGLTEGVHCAVCDAVLIPQTQIEALGHTYGDWTVDVKPSFTAPGSQHQSCINCSFVNAEVIEQLPFPVLNYGVVLGGGIGLTFVIDPQNITDATMTFTVATSQEKIDAITYSYTYDELAKRNFNVEIPVASGQMTENITVMVDSKTNGSANKDYTVYGYCNSLLEALNDPAYVTEIEYTAEQVEATKVLVKYLLNYGGAAQNYFEYKTDDLASEDIIVDDVEVPELINDEKPQASKSGSVEGISFYGCSLVHWSKTAVNFYFYYDGDISDYEFTVNNAEFTPVANGYMCYVTVDSFNPQDLGRDAEVVVSNANGTQTLTVSYSPLDYIVRIYYNDSASDELKNLVRAMYGYHLAAVDYLA